MNEMYMKIEQLCDQKGVKVAKMASETGVSKSTLSDLKNGRTQKLSAESIAKISDYFGVSSDHLLGKEQKETPILTKKDERDIARQMEAMLGQIDDTSNDALMFDGEPLDDETRELLRASIKNQLEITKRLAKQKYTPNKYRK